MASASQISDVDNRCACSIASAAVGASITRRYRVQSMTLTAQRVDETLSAISVGCSLLMVFSFAFEAPQRGLDAVRPRTAAARVNRVRKEPERKKVDPHSG